MKKNKLKEKEPKVHISAEIRLVDQMKLNKYTSRNISKLIREFISWTFSSPIIEEAIYVRGDSINTVLSVQSILNIEETVRKVIREELKKN